MAICSLNHLNQYTLQSIHIQQSVRSYHAKLIVSNKHRLSCQCYLCNKSHFHSSPHLLCAQEQLQKEVESETEIHDERDNIIELTEETRNTKIDYIVDEIAKLNLLEVAQLVTALKSKLNLPDTAMMGAPMMAAPAATTAATGAAEEAGICIIYGLYIDGKLLEIS